VFPQHWEQSCAKHCFQHHFIISGNRFGVGRLYDLGPVFPLRCFFSPADGARGSDGLFPIKNLPDIKLLFRVQSAPSCSAIRCPTASLPPAMMAAYHGPRCHDFRSMVFLYVLHADAGLVAGRLSMTGLEFCDLCIGGGGRVGPTSGRVLGQRSSALLANFSTLNDNGQVDPDGLRCLGRTGLNLGRSTLFLTFKFGEHNEAIHNPSLGGQMSHCLKGPRGRGDLWDPGVQQTKGNVSRHRKRRGLTHVLARTRSRGAGLPWPIRLNARATGKPGLA